MGWIFVLNFWVEFLLKLFFLPIIFWILFFLWERREEEWRRKGKSLEFIRTICSVSILYESTTCTLLVLFALVSLVCSIERTRASTRKGQHLFISPFLKVFFVQRSMFLTAWFEGTIFTLRRSDAVSSPLQTTHRKPIDDLSSKVKKRIVCRFVIIILDFLGSKDFSIFLPTNYYSEKD